jgi:hypothetical protein
MKKILVFGHNQPCLDVRGNMGLNRDRNPDRDWSELRDTTLLYAKEVEMTNELKQILLEDLAYTYGSVTDKFASKLKEFGLV